ncbi:MAG: ABC transporter substrate-binding protein [Chloroflexota bacterium]|nr:ABC transporter substrate-binding protein [Chloroflexota bacterium]
MRKYQLKQGAWWVALALLGALLLSACGGGDDESTPAAEEPAAAPAPTAVMQDSTTVSPTAAPAEPEPAMPKVDRVIMAVTPPSTEFSAPRMGGQPQAFQVRPIYEYLIGIDAETGGFVPELATEWSLEPDGLSFRFKLREGVKWQKDFGEFSAEDVVFTHEQFIKEDSVHGQTTSYAEMVSSVDIVNDHEVIFRLGRPAAEFITVMSAQQGNMGDQVSKAHHEAEGEPLNLNDSVVGTGPYQLLEREQERFLIFERVPYEHWRITPDFPEFEYRWLAEASTRLAALIAGEVHLASIPKDNVGTATSEGMKLIQGKVPGQRTFIRYYCCNFDSEANAWTNPDSPLMDIRVRKAFSKAVDRPQLNEAFFAGAAVPMYNAHQNPSREGWDETWVSRFEEEYGYDPVAARELLAEAGYGPNNPVDVNLFVIRETRGIPASIDLTEAIGGYLQDIGANVKLLHVERSGIGPGTRNPPFEFNNHLNLDITSSDLFIAIRVKNSGTGLPGRLYGFATADMDDAYYRMISEVDDVKRNAIAREWGNLHYDNHASNPLFWVPAEIVVNPEFVADYVWPGAFTGTWSHIANIKSAT